MWNRRIAHGYRTIWVISTLLVSSIALAYAGSDPPPPSEPIDSEIGALGMYLKMRSPIRILKLQPQLVFFARLEEGEGIEDLDRKTDLIPSTFVDGYHVYLLDVPPGTYVAVAAIYWKEYPPDLIEIPLFSVGPLTFEYYLEFLNRPDTFRHYFTKQLIEETKTTSRSRSFSFMGKFVADVTSKLKTADEIQRHFMQMLEGSRANTPRIKKGLKYGDYSFLLFPHEVDRSKSAEIKFFRKAKKHLKEDAWAMVIEERLEGQ